MRTSANAASGQLRTPMVGSLKGNTPPRNGQGELQGSSPTGKKADFFRMIRKERIKAAFFAKSGLINSLFLCPFLHIVVNLLRFPCRAA